MKSHDMKSNVVTGGSNERLLSDSKKQTPASLRGSVKKVTNQIK